VVSSGIALLVVMAVSVGIGSGVALRKVVASMVIPVSVLSVPEILSVTVAVGAGTRRLGGTGLVESHGVVLDWVQRNS